MTDAQLLELMARYRLAYGAADEKTLAAVVSDDCQTNCRVHKYLLDLVCRRG